MTSHLEITFWEDEKEEKRWFFASFPSDLMAAEQTLMLAHLSKPRTAESLHESVLLHHFLHRSAPGPDDYLVTRINVYKQRRFLQHEAVLISFKCQAEGELEHHLLVERNVEFASLCTYFLHFSQSVKLASDTACLISTAEPPETYGEVVWSLTIPNNIVFKINLAQISTLLSVVSQTEEAYNLTRTNCYWFSGLIHKTLLRLVQGSNPPAEVEIWDQLEQRRCFYRIGYFLSWLPFDGGHRAQALVEHVYHRFRFYGFYRMGHFMGWVPFDGGHRAQALVDDVHHKYNNLYQSFLNSWVSYN